MTKSSVIDNVGRKVELLIEDNRKLKSELAQSERQNSRLQSDKRELAARIAELEGRIAVLELEGAVAGAGGNTKLARARVNRLMREVDKCIALLNR